MFEQQAILRSNKLVTVETLADDLRRLGLRAGQTVIVHSSLSRIGWVCGGPVAVVQALLDVLTDEGTLVMPTHSGDYSEPSKWQLPPVPESWWEGIRASMPVFDPRVTPTRGMGAIPECFRTWPGTLRSDHPALSFAARGKHAQTITMDHSLSYALGECSPLARLYDLGAKALLIGVGYDSNTSFHLAENRVPNAPETIEGAPVLADGKREWREYREIDFDTDRFEEIGAAFESERTVVKGKIGVAESRFFDVREGVDYARDWLFEHKRSEG
ncbi:aminoglycoside N(3)-acetyltransferase [Cohnella fermenti]|uniref:Aminoglycoside N(3)-acetyltransferase n=1 Tax=Cohnella fermenti TaxID=2565925 RepID=A0A4S4C0N3_9BACL|nr:AAC(3) family N-acetyltransferase [Cohnella fermenti]THF81181.1 AAC(3) family N-acetyltransferase [Cohnella fermenti]